MVVQRLIQAGCAQPLPASAWVLCEHTQVCVQKADSKAEETFSSACALVQSLEITQEPYLTHSSKAGFTDNSP